MLFCNNHSQIASLVFQVLFPVVQKSSVPAALASLVLFANSMSPVCSSKSLVKLKSFLYCDDLQVFPYFFQTLVHLSYGECSFDSVFLAFLWEFCVFFCQQHHWSFDRCSFIWIHRSYLLVVWIRWIDVICSWQIHVDCYLPFWDFVDVGKLAFFSQCFSVNGLEWTGL